MGHFGHFLQTLLNYFKSEGSAAKREEVHISAEIGRHRRNETRYEHLAHNVHNGTNRAKHFIVSLFAGLTPILAFEYFRPEWDAMIGRHEIPATHAMSTISTLSAHFLS